MDGPATPPLRPRTKIKKGNIPENRANENDKKNNEDKKEDRGVKRAFFAARKDAPVVR